MNAAGHCWTSVLSHLVPSPTLKPMSGTDAASDLWGRQAEVAALVWGSGSEASSCLCCLGRSVKHRRASQPGLPSVPGLDRTKGPTTGQTNSLGGLYLARRLYFAHL